MQPAKLLHVPKCTTLIWNMDGVCIFNFFSFCITIYWLSYSSFSPLFLPYSFSFFLILFLCSFTVLLSLSLVYLTISAHKQISGLFIYSALPISRCHFSPNNSRRTPITRSLGRDMDVILEFEILPKFYIRNGCAEWNIVLYCTAIYRESRVLCSFVVKWYTHECLTKCKI